MQPSSSASSHGPFIVCGMHRSGTSYTASLFQTAGLHLGDQLLGPGTGNEISHFEDLGILDFHMRALRALGLGSEGFTTQPIGRLPDAFQKEARRLAYDRSRLEHPWGWKEPRTVLFLSLWRRVVPKAKYVFVFRRPWEVVDSLLRRGDDVFASNPALAVHVWLNYNKRIVDFVQRHPQDCVVFEISQIIHNPAAAVEKVRLRFNVAINAPEDGFRSDLFHATDDPSRAKVIWAICPEARNLYVSLRQLAGCKPTAIPAVPTISELSGPAVAEWCRATQAEINVSTTQADVATLRQERQSLLDAITSLRAESDRLVLALSAAQESKAAIVEELSASRAACESVSASLAAERDQLRGAVAEREAAKLAAHDTSAAMEAMAVEKRVAEEKLRILEAVCDTHASASPAGVESLQQASHAWSVLERSIQALGATSDTLRDECQRLSRHRDQEHQAFQHQTLQLLSELIAARQQEQKQTMRFHLSDLWRKLARLGMRRTAVHGQDDDKAESDSAVKPFSTFDAA